MRVAPVANHNRLVASVSENQRDAATIAPLQRAQRMRRRARSVLYDAHRIPPEGVAVAEVERRHLAPRRENGLDRQNLERQPVRCTVNPDTRHAIDLVSREEVDAFQAKYVLSSGLAKARGCGCGAGA